MLPVCYLARFSAFFVRAFAAALDAFVALALRCSGVSFLARAKPPLRPIFRTGDEWFAKVESRLLHVPDHQSHDSGTRGNPQSSRLKDVDCLRNRVLHIRQGVKNEFKGTRYPAQR